ncbi:MAG: hypothetical protein R6U96_01295 [Promethearchaeia archaeon]
MISVTCLESLRRLVVFKWCKGDIKNGFSGSKAASGMRVRVWMSSPPVRMSEFFTEISILKWKFANSGNEK